MAAYDQPEDAGHRLFAALGPLLKDVEPAQLARQLPELVRDVTGGEAAAIAVLDPAEPSAMRFLYAAPDEPGHTEVAVEAIRAMIAAPGSGVVPQRATLRNGEEIELLVVALDEPDTRTGIVCTQISALRGFTPLDRQALELMVPWLRRMLAAAATESSDALDDGLRRELAATERERKRWARNLHDETLQALGVLRFGLAAALESPESDDRTAMVSAVAALAEQIESLRGLIDDLRPAALDQLGLESALGALLERVRRVAQVRVDTRLAFGDESQRLPDELELMVYRLVQEALNNIVKHAGATTVRLAVGLRRGCLEVLVADDGCGFDVHALHPGSGLAGMAERAALARGNFEIRSRLGTGTTIEVEVPL